MEKILKHPSNSKRIQLLYPLPVSNSCDTVLVSRERVKLPLLIFLFLFSLSAFSQDTIFNNDYDTLYYQSPPVPVVKMNAVVRMPNKAIAKLEVSNLLVGDIVGYIDDNGVYSTSFITETDTTIILTQLGLNKKYTVVLNYGTANEYIVDEINTFSQYGNPISLSNKFLERIESWTSQEETNPSLPILYHYLKEDPILDIVEKLYFFQRMYLDSMQMYPSSILTWVPIENNFNWILLPGIELWDPANINPCKCNYTINIAPYVSPGHWNKDMKKYDPDEKNHGRQYFGDGSDVFSHLHEFGNGPAQHHKFRLRVHQPFVGERTRNAGAALSTNQTSAAYKSQLFWRLLCDRTLAGGAVPEECKCEKKIDIAYRYDSKLMAEAKSLDCFLCNEIGASVSIEDWTLVTVQQGSNFTVLSAGKGESKANCNDVGLIGNATSILSTASVFALSAGAFVAAPSPATVTAAATSFQNYMNSWLNVFSPNNESCGTSGTNPPFFTLVDGTRTLTLKANEPIWITMFNTHLFQTKAKRAGEAKAEKISNYYLTATISQNTTQNEFDYCCSKKVAAYNLGSFNNAPLNLLQTQDALGFFLGLKGPWDSPYSNSNPRIPGGIIVPHELHSLTGNSGCDMVKINYAGKVLNNSNNKINIVFTDENFRITEQSLDYLSNNVGINSPIYKVEIYDISGRLLYSKDNVLANEANVFPQSLPFNQTLILKITNNYENQTFKFIR